MQRIGAIGPVPERLGRHAHDDVPGGTGHDRIDRTFGGAADVVHHDEELLVVGDAGVGYDDARKVVRDTGWTHIVVLGLHAGIGRRRHHTELHAVAK